MLIIDIMPNLVWILIQKFENRIPNPDSVEMGPYLQHW